MVPPRLLATGVARFQSTGGSACTQPLEAFLRELDLTEILGHGAPLTWLAGARSRRTGTGLSLTAEVPGGTVKGLWIGVPRGEVARNPVAALTAPGLRRSGAVTRGEGSARTGSRATRPASTRLNSRMPLPSSTGAMARWNSSTRPASRNAQIVWAPPPMRTSRSPATCCAPAAARSRSLR